MKFSYTTSLQLYKHFSKMRCFAQIDGLQRGMANVQGRATTVAPSGQRRDMRRVTVSEVCHNDQMKPKQQLRSCQGSNRRDLLLFAGSATITGAVLQPCAAVAGPLEDVARGLTRPEVTELEAAVSLLDARATLRDMGPLVASAPDSRERFDGRRLWPAYARWLRPVGPAAPVAASIIAGVFLHVVSLPGFTLGFAVIVSSFLHL